MTIAIEDIYEFHRVRTACHIATLNWFAGLLGMQFPEHDNDKNIEPMRTGYAYKNYASYHHGYYLPENYDELFNIACSTHHKHATHHVEFYGNDVSKIPDIVLAEMLCDWASANFEQRFVLCDYKFNTVWDWFVASMADMNWTPKQLKKIRDMAEFLDGHIDKDAVLEIWETVLTSSEL